MKLGKEDILQFIKDDNVKSIHLSFCDIFGREKNIIIMPEELKQAFRHGIPCNISQVKHFGEGIYRNVLLHPEPETFSDMPWRPDSDRAVRMYCNMTFADGTPFTQRGTKSLLIQAIKEAEAAGYEFYFSTELEFYLFKLDKDGNPTKEPLDNAGLFDIPPEDRCEDVRRGACLALEQMEIYPNNAYHEGGPGQNKISFPFSDPLTAGNNVTTLKAIVKNEALNRGCFADLSPKPIADKQGNGFHIGISVRSDDGTGASSMEHAIAGILDKALDIAPFVNPGVSSFERIEEASAPKIISWTTENRNHLIRFPEAASTYRTAILRLGDSYTNPYFIFALLIYAGLYGIENKLELPPPANFDLETATPEQLSYYQKIPHNLEDAINYSKNSEFIQKYVPEDIIHMYLDRDIGKLMKKYNMV